MIADIATVFHWGPSEYDNMTLSDLLLWHRRAVARSGNET
ncbi:MULTISPECIES: GpE family phage tail protein [Providencia]|nr:GpE family phage tail protein [Providencia stuartii]